MRNVTVFITRDKYEIPPRNFLRDVSGNCYIYISELFQEAQYAQLGQPFMKTFFTNLNFEQNLVHFAVSNTVAIKGSILLFPPIVMVYLGLTIAVFPPIIVAFCMNYRYCPIFRRK